MCDEKRFLVLNIVELLPNISDNHQYLSILRYNGQATINIGRRLVYGSGNNEGRILVLGSIY
jgi:hypothetical protein